MDVASKNQFRCDEILVGYESTSPYDEGNPGQLSVALAGIIACINNPDLPLPSKMLSYELF
jgi:hypothetical protein